MDKFTTPILLIAWRRPTTTQQVINALRIVAPFNLYIACDGPGCDSPGEAKKVALTRQLIAQEIDWPCNIKRLYSDTNQGCRNGVSRAITWFFNEVEEGIILEDDCVPHRDFFTYCATLLEKYRNDNRIWCISGCNFQDGIWRGDGSYYFSRYNHCWGWASWRRCWKHYDSDIKMWPILSNSGLMKTIFENQAEQIFWRNIFAKLFYESKPDTWDYQWALICYINGGLTALPNQNLISNIGFGIDATHTTETSKASRNTGSLGEIQHPTFILRDTDADRYTYENHFNGKSKGATTIDIPTLKSNFKHKILKLAKLFRD